MPGEIQQKKYSKSPNQPGSEILLVGGEAGSLEALGRFLVFEGYSVSILPFDAKSELRAIATGSPPKLILLDSFKDRLPDDSFSAILPDVPLVVMVSDGLEHHPLIHCAAVVLRKPVDLEILLQFVQMWCAPCRVG